MRVYRYGIVHRGPLPDAAHEQLFLGNRLWNECVEIHRRSDGERLALMNTASEDVARLVAERDETGVRSSRSDVHGGQCAQEHGDPPRLREGSQGGLFSQHPGLLPALWRVVRPGPQRGAGALGTAACERSIKRHGRGWRSRVNGTKGSRSLSAGEAGEGGARKRGRSHERRIGAERKGGFPAPLAGPAQRLGCCDMAAAVTRQVAPNLAGPAQRRGCCDFRAEAGAARHNGGR